jgi:hypothetical protein
VQREVKVSDLQVPPQHKDGFLAVRDLTDDEFGAFVAMLDGIAAVDCFPVDDLVRQAVDSVPRLSKKEAQGIIRALQSVQTGRTIHGDSLTGFANGIATSDSLKLAPEEAALLARRIEILANPPAIGVTAKAADVAREHERIFHSARILTDIRPVFDDDASNPPVGAVVTHTLRIDSFTKGSMEDYFVALDTRDLIQLQTIVNRAIEKNRSLNRVLDSIGFSRFKISEDG